MPKILITSALPYANGPLHFGHMAGAYLPGDVYARFERMQGNDVLYICGSDEYGMAISLSAYMAGKTPQEHVDHFHAINKELFRKLSFSFDHYSRTTTPFHKEPVQKFFLDLLEKGYIEEKETEQLYSEKEGRFLADRYVVGTCPKCGFEEARGDECPSCGASFDAIDLKNPKSKLTSLPLTKKKTSHFFLKLELFKERLLEWLKTKNWKPNVVKFIEGYIQDLHPRSITRDSDWGIDVPLPNREGKKLYVWFDAPIGYISATMEWASLTSDKDKWKDYWEDKDTKLVQFIGKDNIPFHAAIFPAMVMGQTLPLKLVDELPANEFYMLEGRQFSKSEGWYIDLDTFFEKYTADQIRYVIAATAPETGDSDFTWKEFQLKVNGDLNGKLGNFIHRTFTFIKNNFGSHVPEEAFLDEIDEAFIADMNRLTEEIKEHYQAFRLRQVTQTLMELAQKGNIFFDKKRPWKKLLENRLEVETTLSLCVECIYRLSLLIAPLMPEAAQKVWEMLGLEGQIEKQVFKEVLYKKREKDLLLKEPVPLFTKVEEEQIEEEMKQLKRFKEKVDAVKEKQKKETYVPLKESISIDDVRKIDLRVAEIIKVEKVPKSQKLLKLTVNLGFETRVIVSGISKFYTEEALLGKKIAIVANLKPALLMNIESQGMVLAGSDSDFLELPFFTELPLGSVIS